MAYDGEESGTHRIEIDLKNLKEETKMSDDNTAALVAAMMGNRGADGTGAAAIGGGLGAGVLGGLLGGVLFNRGGLGAAAAVAGEGVCAVTPALLASSLAQVTDTAQASIVLQTLGDIKAAIPLAEGQVQLALAGAQADINGNISTGLQVAIAGQAGINKNISDAIATALASHVDLKSSIMSTASVLGTGIANLATAGLQNTYMLNTAIRDDGERTRALIATINQDTLNRQLTLAETALLEQRNIGRTRDLEINVTQSVMQVQAQAQTQQQQQQQIGLLSHLCGVVGNLQNAVTNSNLIVGNSGAVATGPQTANPVNVRA